MVAVREEVLERVTLTEEEREGEAVRLAEEVTDGEGEALREPLTDREGEREGLASLLLEPVDETVVEGVLEDVRVA